MANFGYPVNIAELDKRTASGNVFPEHHFSGRIKLEHEISGVVTAVCNCRGKITPLEIVHRDTQ